MGSDTCVDVIVGSDTRVGVVVGSSDCPCPQLDITKLMTKTRMIGSFVFIACSLSFGRSGLVEVEHQEQIRMYNLHWDSHPAVIFQPSLSSKRGKVVELIYRSLLQVQVSMEHLASIQFQELVHGVVVKLRTVDQALHCPSVLQARTRQ